MKNKRFSRRWLAVILAIIVCAVPVFARGSEKMPQLAARKTGINVMSNAKAVVDASNLPEGYLLVRYTGGKNTRIKVQISFGETVYTYDLNNKGSDEVFPLSEGDGRYTVRVFENTTGKKYAQAYSTTVDLKLRNEFLPFLYANQYVNFHEKSKAVAKAAELTRGQKTELDKLSAVYHYVVNNTAYDYAFASTVQSGYLPNVDATLASGKGICFDYAALMTAMLRSQGIPSKLVIGYAGDIYHAWINVYIQGQGWIQKAIRFDGVSWTLMDPTFASTGGANDQTMRYITTEANYEMKYVY